MKAALPPQFYFEPGGLRARGRAHLPPASGSAAGRLEQVPGTGDVPAGRGRGRERDRASAAGTKRCARLLQRLPPPRQPAHPRRSRCPMPRTEAREFQPRRRRHRLPVSRLELQHSTATLRAAPFVQFDDACPKENFSLVPVALESWGGFIFLNLSREAPPPLAGRSSTKAERMLGPLSVRGNAPRRAARLRRARELEGAARRITTSATTAAGASGALRARAGVPREGRRRARLGGRHSAPRRRLDIHRLPAPRRGRRFPGSSETERTHHKGEIVYPNLLLSAGGRAHRGLHALADGPGPRRASPANSCSTNRRLRKPGFDPSDVVDFWDVVNLPGLAHLRERAARHAHRAASAAASTRRWKTRASTSGAISPVTSASWPEFRATDAGTVTAKRHDVVVIGGGHNGLTAAFYLARAGLSVLVLERREILGGCAVTEEIDSRKAPGCRVSTASYMASMLRPEVIRDLALDRHGLRMVAAEPTVQAVTPDGIVLAVVERLRAHARAARAVRAGRLRAFPRDGGPARRARAPPRAALHAGAARPVPRGLRRLSRAAQASP